MANLEWTTDYQSGIRDKTTISQYTAWLFMLPNILRHYQFPHRKRALVSKVKLDLARARPKEDAEAARVAHEYKQRMELERLEEEATLAELEWKIEMDNLTESKLSPVVSSALNTSTFIVNKQSHSTPVTSEYVTRDGFNSQPSAVYVISNGAPQSTEPNYPAISRPSDTDLTQNESPVKGLSTTTPSAGIN